MKTKDTKHAKMKSPWRKNLTSALCLLLMFLFLIAAGGCGGGSGEQSVGPNDPSNPNNPVNPADPANPTDPSNPGNPTDSTDPDDPSDSGNSGTPGNTINPIKPGEVGDLEVKVHSFKLDDWKTQEWQKAGKSDGELNPYVPVSFTIEMTASRPGLTTDDKVWVALSLIQGKSSMALANGEFSTRASEPSDDPLYLGFCQLEVEDGQTTYNFSVYPRTTARAGSYTGIRAEAFIPANGGVVEGKTIFDWTGSVKLLGANDIPVLDNHWTELTFNADPPRAQGTDGFDFDAKALVDPVTGYRRYFVGDTPVSQDQENANANKEVAGYFADLQLSLEVMAPTGTVKYIEITEDHGVKFWDSDKNDFVSTLKWDGRHIDDKSVESLMSGKPALAYAAGFPRGLNGMAVVVGQAGNAAPTTRIDQLAFTIEAYNTSNQRMSGNVTSASDETIRAQSAAPDKVRRTADKPDYPFVLPANKRRVDLPVNPENRTLDFSSNSYTWYEDLTNSDKWTVGMGPFVDYTGSGKRTIYGSETGNKEKFAARAYVMFEEYSGLVHRTPADGVYGFHDLSTAGGTRTAAELAVWMIDNKFTILFAGAELRSDIYAKIATKKDAANGGEHTLVTPWTSAQANAQMESEFNAELSVLEIKILAYPLSATNAKAYTTSSSRANLFKYSLDPEPAVEFNFYSLDIRAGIRAEFGVDLRLSSGFEEIKNGSDVIGVRGTGVVALIPYADIKGFAEGGVNIVIAAVYLGIELRFIKLGVVPYYALDGAMTWANGAQGKPPVAKAVWSGTPGLDLEINTLDGSLYVKGEFLGISAKHQFFSWDGLYFYLNLWKGKPSDRPALTLDLRRR